MKTDEYQITLTKEQVLFISRACEVVARVKLGQFSALVEDMQLPENCEMTQWELICYINRLLKPILGLDQNASWSVGKFPDADILFDIHEVLRHQIAWDNAIDSGKVESMDMEKRDFTSMVSVQYDTPYQWNKTVPLLKITKVKNEKS